MKVSRKLILLYYYNPLTSRTPRLSPVTCPTTRVAKELKRAVVGFTQVESSPIETSKLPTYGEHH